MTVLPESGGIGTHAASFHSGQLARGLEPLWFTRYRIRLIPRTPLLLPFYRRGAILRGAFGLTLRGLVCHDMRLMCRDCPLCAECPYPQTFEPAPPENGSRLSNFSDIPRPFVFDPPDDERVEFRSGEPVEFGLTVVGRAASLTPYFVTAFRKLGDDGLGPRRAKFDLTAVVAVLPTSSDRPLETAIFRNTESLIRVAAPTLRARDLNAQDDSRLRRLTLHFRTPVDLRDRGSAVVVPEFGPLIRRLRDRASSLSAFFGDGPLQIDFRGVSELADTAHLVSNRTQVVKVSRRSGRTGQAHDIGGLVGDATYEGEAIGKLMALIRLGEVIHVGKHAAFGNGRIAVSG